MGGQGKREEAGGEERKERGGGSRKRDEKCKNIEGREKREFFARAAPRKEEGDKEREGWGLPPPCPPSHIWKAGCNHFEKCVDPSTLIIIEIQMKKLENILCEHSSKVRQIFFFFFFFCLRNPPPPFPYYKSGT